MPSCRDCHRPFDVLSRAFSTLRVLFALGNDEALCIGCINRVVNKVLEGDLDELIKRLRGQA